MPFLHGFSDSITAGKQRDALSLIQGKVSGAVLHVPAGTGAGKKGLLLPLRQVGELNGRRITHIYAVFHVCGL